MVEPPAKYPTGHYVYLHRRADDGQVFYVGKGQRGRGWCAHSRSAEWLAESVAHGWHVEIAGVFDDAMKAFELEEEMVRSLIAAGHPLANKSLGGAGGATGYQWTEEQRAKLCGRGRPWSVEQRRRFEKRQAEARAARPPPSPVVWLEQMVGRLQYEARQHPPNSREHTRAQMELYMAMQDLEDERRRLQEQATELSRP